MAEEKIRLPSGMGGLTHYDEETGSKLKMKPIYIVIFIIIIILIEIVLHLYGARWIGP